MRRWLGVLVVVIASSTDAHADSEHDENVRLDAGIIGSFVSVSDRNGSGKPHATRPSPVRFRNQ